MIGLFGSLFFISLLVERFIEIFIQDPDEREKDRMTAQKKNLIDPAQIQEAELKIKEMRKKRRQTVTFFGFILGLIISLFGVRILTNLIVDPDWGAVQERYVNILDMVLTAGGVNDFASPGRSTLYRTMDKKVVAIPVDLDAILLEGDISSNYSLIPGDVITVPEKSF